MANYFSNQEQGLFQQGLAAQLGLQNEGQDLYQGMGNYGGYLSGMASNYAPLADQLYSQYGQGFTPGQQANILGLNAQGNGLAGVNPLTQDQINGFQLTPQQQQAIMGDPNQVMQNTLANNNTLGAAMTGNSNNIMGAATNGGAGIIGSVNPSAFNLDPGYKQALASALGAEGQTLGAASNNPNLGLSQQFNQNYQFTPQDQQNIINATGLAAGQMYQSQNDALARQAAAQGNASPLAIAAMQQQNNLQSANSQAQAMLGANIQAKQLQLGTTQTAEQMRLGTAQDISSRQMQAGESLAGSQIGAANTQQQLALQGAQMGQSLNLNAYGQAAQLGVGAAENVGNLQNQAIEYATGANQQAGMYADTAGSQRAQMLGTNQQNVSMTGQQNAYNQGMGVNNAMSGRYGSVYGANQGYLGQYAGAMQNNQQYYQGQAGQNYGQQAGMFNNLGGNLRGAYGQAMQGSQAAYGMQSPSMFNTIMGGVGAFAGAAAKGMSSGA